MELMWWEKTVEYAYVFLLSRYRNVNFAAPLSGKPERKAGDAIFGIKDKLILVEFKKSRDCLPTEQSMFYDYQSAKEALCHFNHHWFVYGLLDNSQSFKIAGEHYFNEEESCDALEILEKGIPEAAFNNYLELLSSLKEPDRRGSSGGGHVSPEAMSLVLGIAPNGDIVGSMALHEFAPQLFPIPPRPVYSPEAPSMKLDSSPSP